VGFGSEKVLRLIEEGGASVVCMENCSGYNRSYSRSTKMATRWEPSWLKGEDMSNSYIIMNPQAIAANPRMTITHRHILLDFCEEFISRPPVPFLVNSPGMVYASSTMREDTWPGSGCQFPPASSGERAGRLILELLGSRVTTEDNGLPFPMGAVYFHWNYRFESCVARRYEKVL
jgi:hypothetical protein